jgi:hypothetical protein
VNSSSRPDRGRCVGLAAAAILLAAGALAETPTASVSIDGMRYALSRAGADELVIEAERAETASPDGRVTLTGVHARMGSFAGAASRLGGLELRCSDGSLDPRSGEFVASGAIEGRTGDGRQFRTERLRYRHDQALVASEAPVWIRDSAGTSYRGGGFRYWVRENRFRLVGGASIVQGKP